MRSWKISQRGEEFIDRRPIVYVSVGKVGNDFRARLLGQEEVG